MEAKPLEGAENSDVTLETSAGDSEVVLETSDGGVVTLAEVVKLMMDKQLVGGRAPRAHAQAVEIQQAWAAKLFQEILHQVALGNPVRIKNFGKFSLRITQEYARNPSSGVRTKVVKPNRLRFAAAVGTADVLNVPVTGE